MMSGLRENIPETIGGVQVSEVRDYGKQSAKNMITGEITTIQLPKSNVLEFVLGASGSVIARPSGTEPKVKFYYTAVAPTVNEAKMLLDAFIQQMSEQ